MARSREAEVLIVDTNPSIGIELTAAKDALVQHVQQKLIQMPTKSEIGLVVLGSKRTENNLAGDGAYQNISEVKAIEQTDVKLLKTILELKLGVDAGDWLDAVVVAMDMLKRHCGDKKFEKGIIVITNEGRPVSDLDQLPLIAQALLDFKIQFQFYRMSQAVEGGVGAKKESVISKFVEQVGGQVHSVSNAQRLKGAMSKRSVTSQSVFRGSMHLYPKVATDGGGNASLLSLKVWAYAKTKVATLPSLKKRSRESDDGSLYDVELQRKYVLEDDNTQEVDFANLIKAHSYGREDVPISKDDANSIKKKAEKEVYVLGYMKRCDIGPEELMGNVDCFLPDRDSPMPMLHAFSAFVEALKSSDHAALIRWVRRANDAPKLYTIWPGREGTSPCLYACRRPFCEDLRPCPFPNLKPAAIASKDSRGVNEHLGCAVDKLIASLDLDKSLEYSNEFNPVVQGFYSLVNTKVTDGAWRPADSNLCAGKCLQRDTRLWGQQPVRDALQTLATTPGLQWQPPPPPIKDDKVVADKDKEPNSDDGGQINILGATAGTGLIDTNDPLTQFVVVWEAHDLGAHDKAIDGMMEVIDELVRTSPGERFYTKAMECLGHVRSWCDKGRGDEPDVYNQHWHKLQERYQERLDVAFGAWLRRHAQLGPIPTDVSPLVPPDAPPEARGGEKACSDDDDGAIMDAD